MPLRPRNHPLGFAARTWKNLEFIENAFEAGEDVHVVTQLVVSLLGLVVFPRERRFNMDALRVTLDDLEAGGWPSWSVEVGHVKTLNDVVRHLRNSIAHGRIHFTSESRRLHEVVLIAEDVDPSTGRTVWKASMAGDDLRKFCRHLSALLEKSAVAD